MKMKIVCKWSLLHALQVVLQIFTFAGSAWWFCRYSHLQALHGGSANIYFCGLCMVVLQVVIFAGSAWWFCKYLLWQALCGGSVNIYATQAFLFWLQIRAS